MRRDPQSSSRKLRVTLLLAGLVTCFLFALQVVAEDAVPTPAVKPAVTAPAPTTAAPAAPAAAKDQPEQPAPAAEKSAPATTPAAPAGGGAAGAIPDKPANTPVAQESREDTFSIGDLIRIRMDEDPTIAFEGAISAAGTVPVPYVGEFLIANLTQAQAAKALAEAVRKDLYQQATFTVTLITKAPGKIYVYGAVRRPGMVDIPPLGNLTVMQVLSYVDGLTSWAAPEDTYILRRTKRGEPPQRIPLNLTEIFANYTPLNDADVALQVDDVLCVPGVDGKLNFSADTCEIIIVGEIGSPGIIYFAPGEQRTLMRAIFKAGGFSKFAKSTAVRLIRYGKNKERTEQVINASRIIDDGYLNEDVELKPGDMLIVPQKIINF